MDLFLIFVLIVLNAAFALAEMALTASRKALLDLRAETGDEGARVALDLMAHPTQFLSSVQVGITAIGILNGIVGEAAFSAPLSVGLQSWSVEPRMADYIATGIVVSVITFLTIVFGEVVPKRIGQLYPEAVACLVARPVRWVARLTSPFVWLLTKTTSAILLLVGVDAKTERTVTSEEINAILDEGLDAGVIDQQEHSLVQNVFELDDRPLTSLMLRKADIAWLTQDMSLEDALDVAAQTGHSWYPVRERGGEGTLGIVSVSGLLQRHQGQRTDWLDLIQSVSFVPETLNAMVLLAQFQKRAERMVLVVDEYGQVQGLITLQDLLQAITGELYVPVQGTTPSSTLQPGGSWLLDGQLSIQDLKSKLELQDLPNEEENRYHTLGGLLMSELGHLPVLGSCVKLQGWQFEVTQMDGHRVVSVRATPTQPPPQSEF